MAKEQFSWEEKLKRGIPLNELEETKYAATRNTLRRIREQEEERKFAEQKANNALDPLFGEAPSPADEAEEKQTAAKDSKKGN